MNLLKLAHLKDLLIQVLQKENVRAFHQNLALLILILMTLICLRVCKELALWSWGRVDGSQSEGLRFDPHVSQKFFLQSPRCM